MRINCAVSVDIYIFANAIWLNFFLLTHHYHSTTLGIHSIWIYTAQVFISQLTQQKVSLGTWNLPISWPAACSVTSFTFPLIWSTVLPIIHCFGTWQKRGKPCQRTHKCPSFMVVDLKQLYFSFVLAPWCCLPTWMLRRQANTPRSIRKGSLWCQLLWNLWDSHIFATSSLLNFIKTIRWIQILWGRDKTAL